MGTLFNKRDPKLPPLGPNKRGRVNPKKENGLAQTATSPEGQNAQLSQEGEKASLESLESEPSSRGVEG